MKLGIEGCAYLCVYEFKEAGKDTARMGFRNGLKEGLFT